MTSPIIESFSITHAAILDGTTGAEASDIYGVREGSITIDSDSYSNTGDDQILSFWNWFNNATITVTSGFFGLDMMAIVTGAAVTSSAVTGGQQYSQLLWNESSLNMPPRPVLLQCPARDSDGASMSLKFVLFKCQFQPITFDGPSYKNGLSASWTAQAVMSDKDEKGTALVEKAIGRLVAGPAA